MIDKELLAILVCPQDRLPLHLAEAALVEGIVTVDGNVVAKGKLSFARKVV